jgi:hypothetical protein
VLRLLYGNDKRNPVRTLDLAQTLTEGEIHLLSGGFAPGSGEVNELWSGESIRFDGSKKLAESRKNARLQIKYVLKTDGSGAALSYYQRKINRFLLDAKQYNTHHRQGQKVWLEYRWSDGLSSLPTPGFGQLSYYYEIYSANVPRWPDNLHENEILEQGLIEGVVLELITSPVPEGLKQKAAVAGGLISLNAKGVLIASGGSSKLHWTGYTGSGLTGNFTVTGWITLNAAWSSGSKVVFDYYFNAANRIQILYDADNSYWTITKIVGGVTFTDNTATDTVTNGDDVHLCLVQDSTTLRLYVNGAATAAAVVATNTMTDGGTIALGCPATGTIDGIDGILDGWRTLPDDFTSTEAATLYAAELPIKTDGGQVGPPLYWWTKDSDSNVDNYDDATHDNWGILGGVGGDVEARMEIRLGVDLTHDIGSAWLGLKPMDATFTPSSSIYFDFSGTADAPSSGGAYQQQAGTGTTFDYSGVKTSQTFKSLLGKYRVLARYRLTYGLTATLTPKYILGGVSGVACSGKARNYTGIGAFQLVDLGDLFIEHPADILDESTGHFSFSLTTVFATSSAYIAQLDFIQLLPEGVEIPIDSGSVPYAPGIPLVIDDGAAYTYSDGTSLGFGIYTNYPHSGQPLRPVPQKYNYLFAMYSNANDTMIGGSDYSNLTIYVTPRYLLPGGMVA